MKISPVWFFQAGDIVIFKFKIFEEKGRH